MRIRFLFVWLGLLFILPVSSQVTDFYSQAYLSPEASSLYELQKKAPTFSGTLDLSLPLYTVRQGDFHLPLGLSYDSGGNGVESIAPWTGLGWNLVGLPRISRQVRGLPDEGPGGVFYKYGGKTLEEYVAHTTAGEYINQVILINEGELDTQSDIFYLSIPGFTGKFYWDQTSSSFLTEEMSTLQITYQSIPGVFTVVDNGGVHYSFTIKEDVIVPTSQNPSNRVVTSWLASEIRHPSMHAPITIGYSEQNHLYLKNDIQYKYLLTYISNANPNPILSDRYDVSLISAKAQYPSSLIWAEGKVNFIPSTGFREDLNGGKSLSGIEVRDGGNVLVDKFDFTYSYLTGSGESSYGSNKWMLLASLKRVNALHSSESELHAFQYQGGPPPSRLSAQQDVWGYYNGKASNANLIPTSTFIHPATGLPVSVPGADRSVSESHAKFGVLTRVTYPTKGYTNYTHESHRVGSSVAPNAYELVMAYIAAEGGDPSPPNYKEYQTTFVINNPMDLTLNGNTVGGGAFVSADVGALGVTPGDYGAQIFLRGLSASNSSVNFSFVNSFTNQLLPNGTYELKGVFDQNPPNYMDFHCFLSWYKVDSSAIGSNLVGGLRVKEIQDFDHTDVLSLRTRFQYSESLNQPGESSGKLFGSSVIPYGDFIRLNGWYYDPALEAWFKTTEEYYQLRSHPMIDLIAQNNNYTGYSSVFQKDYKGMDSVVTQYRFSLYPDEVNPLPPYLPVQPQGALNGKLLEKINYGYQGSSWAPLRKQVSVYQILLGEQGIYNLYPNDYDISVTNTIAGPTVIDPENYNTPALYPYYFYPMRYELLRDSLIEYTSGYSPFIQISQYTFNATFQLTQRSTGMSDGSVLRTQWKYPNTMSYPGGANELARLWQVSNNEYDRVLEIQQDRLVGSTVYPVSSERHSFKQFGTMASSVYLERSEQWIGGVLSQTLQFDAYNNYGNPQQVRRQKEPWTAYLWGYQGQYPIARVVNATFAELQSVLGSSTVDALQSATVSAASIESALTSLRAALGGSRVQGFTFQPLRGLKGELDTRGKWQRYEYDPLGRLRLVFDFEGYVLQEHLYHFKP